MSRNAVLCEFWGASNAPLDVLPDTTVRDRIEDRDFEEPFTVAVGEGLGPDIEGIVPEYVLTFSGYGIHAALLDTHGSEIESYSWRPQDDEYREPYFLQNIIASRYPDESEFYEVDETVATVQFVIHPDGTGNEDITIGNSPRQLRDFTHLDLTAPGWWQPPPVFGEWDRFGRPTIRDHLPPLIHDTITRIRTNA